MTAEADGVPLENAITDHGDGAYSFLTSETVLATVQITELANGETADFLVETTALGLLQITIEPESAVAAGARWRRVGTDAWRNSGDTESDLEPGTYLVEFAIVPGFETRKAENTAVEAVINIRNAAYTANSTHYQVMAAAAGNQGAVSGDGGFVHNSLVTLTAKPHPGFVFSHWSENGQVAPERPTASSK